MLRFVVQSAGGFWCPFLPSPPPTSLPPPPPRGSGRLPPRPPGGASQPRGRCAGGQSGGTSAGRGLQHQSRRAGAGVAAGTAGGMQVASGGYTKTIDECRHCTAVGALLREGNTATAFSPSRRPGNPRTGQTPCTFGALVKKPPRAHRFAQKLHATPPSRLPPVADHDGAGKAAVVPAVERPCHGVDPPGGALASDVTAPLAAFHGPLLYAAGEGTTSTTQPPTSSSPTATSFGAVSAAVSRGSFGVERRATVGGCGGGGGGGGGTV